MGFNEFTRCQLDTVHTSPDVLIPMTLSCWNLKPCCIARSNSHLPNRWLLIQPQRRVCNIATTWLVINGNCSRIITGSSTRSAPLSDLSNPSGCVEIYGTGPGCSRTGPAPKAETSAAASLQTDT